MSHDSINLESDAVMYHDSIMLKRADLLHLLNHQRVKLQCLASFDTSNASNDTSFFEKWAFHDSKIVELHLLNHHRVNCRVNC